MEICCGKCHVELQEVDLIVMDYMNTLFHRHCYDKDVDYQKDKGTYGYIKNKYLFYREGIENIHS